MVNIINKIIIDLLILFNGTKLNLFFSILIVSLYFYIKVNDAMNYMENHLICCFMRY